MVARSSHSHIQGHGNENYRRITSRSIGTPASLLTVTGNTEKIATDIHKNAHWQHMRTTRNGPSNLLGKVLCCVLFSMLLCVLLRVLSGSKGVMVVIFPPLAVHVLSVSKGLPSWTTMTTQNTSKAINSTPSIVRTTPCNVQMGFGS